MWILFVQKLLYREETRRNVQEAEKRRVMELEERARQEKVRQTSLVGSCTLVGGK